MRSNQRMRSKKIGILEFPASLRGSKATEARNSKFILGILVLGILEFPTMSSPSPLGDLYREF